MGSAEVHPARCDGPDYVKLFHEKKCNNLYIVTAENVNKVISICLKQLKLANRHFYQCEDVGRGCCCCK